MIDISKIDFNKFANQFHGCDISLTFEILKSYIYQTEQSIEGLIRYFKEVGPETMGLDTVDAENGEYQCIDEFMGLYSDDVFLDDMFLKYYPSVTRRSAFLTIYGMLEHDFEKLCNAFTRSKGLAVKLSDLRGSGFERCDLFARKIMKMENSQHYVMIRRVTKLRNLCAHNDARFYTADGQKIKEAVEIMAEFPEYFGEDGNQIEFKPVSLTFIITALRNYFADVELALKNYR